MLDAHQEDRLHSLFSSAKSPTLMCWVLKLDNSCGDTGTSTAGLSVVEWNLVLGKNYCILVRVIGKSQGNFRLQLSVVTGTPSSRPSSKPSKKPSAKPSSKPSSKQPRSSSKPSSIPHKKKMSEAARK
jgi:hypothetical protein